MRNYPDWVLAFTDAELERRFGADTVARGQAYAQQSRVGRVQVTSGTHVLGAVQGSGRSSYETLLYSPELKFYSNKIKMDTSFNTNVRGLHCLGDSSGWTRGLMMASVMGVLMGRKLMEKHGF